MFLYGHVGQVYEGVVQFLDVARVFGGAEAREPINIQVDTERPVRYGQRAFISIREPLITDVGSMRYVKPNKMAQGGPIPGAGGTGFHRRRKALSISCLLPKWNSRGVLERW